MEISAVRSRRCRTPPVNERKALLMVVVLVLNFRRRTQTYTQCACRREELVAHMGARAGGTAVWGQLKRTYAGLPPVCLYFL